MSDFWEKYAAQNHGKNAAQSPQNQPGQRATMPDPFGSPEGLKTQFNQFVGNYRGQNPQEEAARLYNSAPEWQRKIIDQILGPCQNIVQGGFRR